MKCSKCHKYLSSTAIYCSFCGKKVNNNVMLRQKKSVLIILMIFTAFLIFIISINYLNQPTEIITPPVYLDPANEVVADSIINKFICNCGRCSGELLALCKCADAIKERNTIRQYLKNGLSKDKIIIIIERDFGGRIT